MDRNQDKHRLSIADMITLLRIAGTILLLFFPALSPAFFILYALTGLTDVLDGWIARRTKTASDFGARLDSVADLLFYMAKNRNIALTREMLLNNVWGYDFYGDDRTLDTHIKLLRKSLGECSSYLVTLRGVGYRFEV